MKKRKFPNDGDELPIRNSTVEFLVFAKENAADTIAVRFQDKMLWLTLQLMADLFDVDKSVVSRHLTNIYNEGELSRIATVAKFATVRTEGTRQVEVEELGRIVNAYLELAESRAKRRIPMTMFDWATYLDKILSIDDRELLTRASEISAEIAQAHAINEYEKFRERQELEYKSDFDRQLDLLEEQARKEKDNDAV